MRSSLPKTLTLVLLRLRSLSTASNPNPNPNPTLHPKCLLLPRPIYTTDHLHQLFSRSVVSGLLRSSYLPLWNSILHSLALSKSPHLAISLFDLIRKGGIFPDNYTFTSALKAVAFLSLLKCGEKLHSLSVKLGFCFDTFVVNSLINMYSVCGSVGAARRVFEWTPNGARDVVSWNSMISGYLQNNLCVEALQVFAKMVEGSIGIDAFTPVSALIACGRIGGINLGKMIHALVVVNGFELNYYLGSSLVSMYAKCGAVDDARKLFDGMPDRNVVCWTSMISGYTQSGRFRESVELFRDMQVAGVKADDPTIASVVSSCAQMGALDQGRYIHAYCDAHGIGKDPSVNNALMDMYSKCGDVERALQIFHGLLHRDVFSWTVMISGLAMNGYPNEALNLFSQMEKQGEIMPNEVTFLGVLSACSHGGLVEKGFYFFDCMTKVYNLSPKIEHYGCMVDLLGRAKLLTEADNFIREMPVVPDVVIWRSLLFACKAHGDVKLAEHTAQKCLKLDPKKFGGHILLSNVYATTSRWSDVNRVRKDMNDWRISKQPGCSFVELNGIVHEFFAADKSHLETEAIHGVLWGINMLLSSESCSSDIYE